MEGLNETMTLWGKVTRPYKDPHGYDRVWTKEFPDPSQYRKKSSLSDLWKWSGAYYKDRKISEKTDRFKEAKDLVGLNAVKSTTDAEALVSFIKEEATRIQRQDLIQEYIQSQAGATQIIWDHIEKH